MAKVSLQGLDKGEVLAALYNASRPLGMGFLHYNPKPMTPEEGAQLVATQTYFDYLQGRVMKVDLSGDELETWLYNRDNGECAAEKVISELRNNKNVNTATIQEAHKSGVAEGIAAVRKEMEQDHEVYEADMGEALGTEPIGIKSTVFKMGLSDMKEVLEPKVDEALDQVADKPDETKK